MWKGIKFTGQLRKQVAGGGGGVAAGHCSFGVGRGRGAELPVPLPNVPGVSGEH